METLIQTNANEHVLGKPQEAHAYTQLRVGAALRISVIVCVLRTSDFHWDVNII